MKNSPNFLSISDVLPFLDVDVDEAEEVEDDEDEDAHVDVEGMFFLDTGTISDSSHICERTWHIPSSTSGLRLRYPESTHTHTRIRLCFQPDPLLLQAYSKYNL